MFKVHITISDSNNGLPFVTLGETPHSNIRDYMSEIYTEESDGNKTEALDRIESDLAYGSLMFKSDKIAIREEDRGEGYVEVIYHICKIEKP